MHATAAPIGGHAWDAAAAGWNHHTVLIHDWLHDATQSLLDAACIGVGSRVLDVAAGAGDQTLDIARRVGATGCVLATDISPAILALAQSNASAAGYQQVRTQIADAQSLGLAGAGFDAAVCRLGLMFCHSPLTALQEIRAALRSQGRFSALVFAQPQGNPCLVMTLAIARQHAGLPPMAAYEADAVYAPGTLMSLGKPGLMHALLHRAGFTNVQVQQVPAPFRASSVEHYISFVRSSASPVIEMLASLPVQAQHAAWIDMTEQLRMFTTPSGWIGPNQLLLCTAVAP